MGMNSFEKENIIYVPSGKPMTIKSGLLLRRRFVNLGVLMTSTGCASLYTLLDNICHSPFCSKAYHGRYYEGI